MNIIQHCVELDNYQMIVTKYVCEYVCESVCVSVCMCVRVGECV